jgi:hypothetical protein
MTASRKVKVLECSLEDARGLREAGKNIPTRLSNSLYLELFDEVNGRVVIESADYTIDCDADPAWAMSKDQDVKQAEANRLAIREYMRRLDKAREARWDESEPFEERPMDEFEWEKQLRESDELADKHMELWEKYLEHPDRDRIIAREMGWTWLDDALDADERGAFNEEKYRPEDIPPLEPNPMTEGRDWIRTEHGRVKHPLSHRAFEVAMAMWHHCKALGLIGDEGDKGVHQMVFEAQTLGAKLAGALDHLAYNDTPDRGFIVAKLKRALKYLQRALRVSDKIRRRKLLEETELDRFRSELFQIREEMLSLMKYHRR